MAQFQHRTMHVAAVVAALGAIILFSSTGGSHSSWTSASPSHNALSDPDHVEELTEPLMASDADGIVAWTFEYHGWWGPNLSNYITGARIAMPGLMYEGSSNEGGMVTEWSLSGDGRFLAFANYKPNRRGWDILLYDRQNATMVPLPINTTEFIEKYPSISHNGRFIAYYTNRFIGFGTKEGGGGDIHLFDRQTGGLVGVPGLNTQFFDGHPSLGGGARYIAFTSTRANKKFDIYLYDRWFQRLVDLPGLNSTAADYFPSLSGDGNLIAFVSTRMTNECGARHIFLYDRSTASLVPVPGLHDFVEPSPGECGGLDWWVDSNPSINAAGTVIAFESNRSEFGDYHPSVYVYDRRTSSLLEAFRDGWDPSIR